MSVTFADVEAAAKRLAGHALVTPLIENPALNERTGFRVLLKLETLQRVGAFKFRGAFNRLVQLSPDERRQGVVAFSSGNHAQGVALAAKLLGIPALIVMPSDAPKVKLDATRRYGAEIKLYDRLKDSREAIAGTIAAERGYLLVPAFDDPHIIAGQGTVGLEVYHQAQALGVELDAFVSPTSGGGLLAGASLAIKALSPTTAMIGVEPAGFDDLLASLQAGTRQVFKPTTRSLCDALESPAVGEITFPIMQKTVADVAVVTDAEIADAMQYAFATLKLVIEPGGSAGLAALLARKVRFTKPGGAVAVVLSGGNVDPELFGRVLAGKF